MVKNKFQFFQLTMLASVWCLMSVYVNADDVLDNSLKLSVSKKYMSFSIFEEDIEADLSTLGLSWNYSLDKGFFGINLEQTLQDDTVAVTNGFGSLSREDYNLVLGYNMMSWLSVFGGYLYGETTAQIRDFDVTPPFATAVYIRHRGPYLGLGANYSSDYGALGLNVAYANMSGELTSRPLQNEPGNNSSVTTKGSTTGFSYGLQWVGEIDKTMSYSIGFKVNRYRFEDNDLVYRNGSGPRDASTRESFSIIHFGVSKYY